MTEFRSGWTPLFLNAEPAVTGMKDSDSVPLRMRRRSVASSGSSPSR
jgi:hypothetical protein